MQAEMGGRLGRRRQGGKGYHRSKDPTQDDVDENTCCDADTRYLKHGNSVPLSRHPCQSGGTAFQVRREGGKDFVLRGREPVVRPCPQLNMLAILLLLAQRLQLGLGPFNVPSDRGCLDPVHCREYRWSRTEGQRLWRRESLGAHCSA